MLVATVVTLAFLVPGVAYVVAGWPVAGAWNSVTAPAASIFFIGWTGWLLGRVGVTPAPLALLALATALGAVVGLGLRLLPRRPAPTGSPAAARTRWSDILSAAIGVATAAAVTVRLWTATPGWASTVPVYWDASWHGYLIALVKRTGLVDAAHLVPFDPQLPGWTDYYPAGWHIPIGTALAITDGSVPAGYNYGQLLFAAVFLPAGMVALVRVLGARSRVTMLLAPVVVALAYPVMARLVDTTAYDAALALAPGVLAAVLTAARSRWRLPSTLAAAVVSGGVFMTQPAVLVTIAIIAACYVAGSAVRARVRRARPHRVGPQPVWRRLLGFSGWALACAVLVLPWLVLAASHAKATLTYARDMDATYAQALYELLVQYTGMAAAPTLVAVLVVAVLTSVVTRTHRWLVVALLIFAVLYVVARAATSPVRQVLTGFWYTDWWRLGAVFWLLAALLVALTFDELVHRVQVAQRVRRRLLPLVVVAALVAPLAWAVPAWTAATSLKLQKVRSSRTVTPADRAAFDFLSQRVHPGERVLNDWADGSGWLYALDGVDPLSIWMSSDYDRDRAYLINHFSDLGTDPRVSSLLRKYSIRYVYTDHTRDRLAPYRLRLPVDHAGLRLLYDTVDTQVYEITAPSVAG